MGVLLCLCGTLTMAQTTSFNYQGRLSDNGSAANGSYDLQFRLFDVVTGGNQVSSTLVLEDVVATNGIFNVSVDFGATAFPGADRFLEIGVRAGASTGAFTTLGPRQRITANPYSIRSLNASNADVLSSSCVSCVTSGQIQGVQGNQVNGTIPVSAVPAGNANYIQNTTSQQPASNFSISGTGNIGGDLITNGAVGIGTTTPGSFIGGAARVAVMQTTSGQWTQHIRTNNFTAGNSFGLLVDAGTNFVDRAFRIRAQNNADLFSVRGDGFVGIGTDTPGSQLHISSNSTVSTSLTLENLVGASSRQIILSNYGSTGAGLYWSGLDSPNTSSLLAPNLFVLRSTGGIAFSASSAAEHMRLDLNGNLGIGTTTPAARLDVLAGSGQIALSASNSGSGAGVAGKSASGTGVTGISSDGYGVAGISTTDRGVFGSGSIGVHGYSANSYGVYGTTDSGYAIYGHAANGIAGYFDGLVAIPQLQTGGATQLCRGTANLISTCSSSLRYKSNVQTFAGGLNIVERLRPISFDWKESRMPDIGLAAEEVEQVEPVLTFRNDKGEIEGVKYNQLSAVFINAFKDEEKQIEQQQLQIKQQQSQIDGLKALLCLDHPQAAVCN